MADLRQALDDVVRSPPRMRHDLEAIRVRADRRRRNRRIASGAIALAIAVAGAGASFAAFRGAGPAPGDEPIPGPTATPSPGFPRDLVLGVLNGTDVPGIASGTASRLQDEGFRIQHVGNAKPYELTVVKHRRGSGELALEFRDHYFPGARVTGGLSGSFQGHLIVILGQDWQRFDLVRGDSLSDARTEIFMMMKRFLLARESGSGAEPFLSDFARQQYERGADLEGRPIELYPEADPGVGDFGYLWLGRPLYERWILYPFSEGDGLSEILLNRGFLDGYQERMLIGIGDHGELQVLAVMRA